MRQAVSSSDKSSAGISSSEPVSVADEQADCLPESVGMIAVFITDPRADSQIEFWLSLFFAF